MTKLFLETLWKNYVILIQIFKVLVRIYNSKNCTKILLKFQYNVKFETNTSFIIVLTRLLSKGYKKLSLSNAKFPNPFQYLLFYQVYDLKSLLLKWRPSQYNAKIENNSSFGVVFTSVLWTTLWKNSYHHVLYYRFFFCSL